MRIITTVATLIALSRRALGTLKLYVLTIGRSRRGLTQVPLLKSHQATRAVLSRVLAGFFPIFASQFRA